MTVVDGEPGRQIRALWSQLAAAYGADAVADMSIPHLSYHVADEYDRAAVRTLLERLAESTQQFVVPAAGVGFVSATTLVAWVNLVRTPALSRLHRALWDEATAAGTNVVTRYEHDRWFPHVTLGDREALREALSELASALRDGRLPSAIPISNLSLIEETPTGHDLVLEMRLGGG